MTVGFNNRLGMLLAHLQQYNIITRTSDVYINPEVSNDWTYLDEIFMLLQVATVNITTKNSKEGAGPLGTPKSAPEKNLL